MAKTKRKDNLLLFYLIASIAVLITLLAVIANYTPLPLPMHATTQYSLNLRCSSISISVNTVQGRQTTNNLVYAVNKATGMRYDVHQTDAADIQLPLSIENPITRSFTAKSIPSGAYDVFLVDRTKTILASLLNTTIQCD